jgi:hypothetical protein
MEPPEWRQRPLTMLAELDRGPKPISLASIAESLG